MERDEMGCQPSLEGPVLCVNNCGFFGSASNMNMCSKCYKDSILKQEQAQAAASSIENIVKGSSFSSQQEPIVENAEIVAKTSEVEATALCLPSFNGSTAAESSEPKPKEGPNRCSTCKKRVGLTGFRCRCGHLFCGSHRYSDKHDCSFDYRTAGQDAIAKANPVVKAEKLDKI